MPKAPQFIGPGAVDVAFTVNGDAVTVHVPWAAAATSRT